MCAVQRIDRAHIKQQAAKEAARRASNVVSLVSSSAVLPESLYAGAVQDNYVKDYLKYVSIVCALSAGHKGPRGLLPAVE